MHMNQSISFLAAGKKLAFVQAGWHRDIVEQSKIAFYSEMAAHGVDHDLIELIEVPGSLEIPLQCKILAKTGSYQLIVAAGLVVDGGIYRHDFVATTVLQAMMQVQLETEVPILSVVLTPHHFSEDNAHYEFFFEHFKLKGKEAAHACVHTLRNMMVKESQQAAA